MTTYQKFKKLKIDFSAIEFEQAGNADQYVCTPIGARLIGRAGVASRSAVRQRLVDGA